MQGMYHQQTKNLLVSDSAGRPVSSVSSAATWEETSGRIRHSR